MSYSQYLSLTSFKYNIYLSACFAMLHVNSPCYISACRFITHMTHMGNTASICSYSLDTHKRIAIIQCA